VNEVLDAHVKGQIPLTEPSGTPPQHINFV
jgi:hypothetical protein